VTAEESVGSREGGVCETVGRGGRRDLENIRKNRERIRGIMY
jgi:hypothetical protein